MVRGLVGEVSAHTVLRLPAERRAAETLREAGELAREAALEQREVIREMRITLAALEAAGATKSRDRVG